MSLTETTKKLFEQIKNALQLISIDEYVHKNALMANASIGQHVRHVIELFEEMLKGYNCGEINYEKRQRDLQIETDKNIAIERMNVIGTAIHVDDKRLLLTTDYYTNTIHATINTNYYREIVYNIEHTIHHMALIRIAFKSAFNIDLPNEFGVAPSTLKYRAACVQ
jgi:uncharacterized damage-inducible protein DinB